MRFSVRLPILVGAGDRAGGRRSRALRGVVPAGAADQVIDTMDLLMAEVFSPFRS